MSLDTTIKAFLDLINEGLDSPLEKEFVDLLTKCAKEAFGPVFTTNSMSKQVPVVVASTTDKAVAPKKKKGKSGYNIFMSEYGNSHPGTANLFKVASNEWGTMSDADKAPYNDRAKAENDKAADTDGAPKASTKSGSRKLNGYHLYVRAEKAKNKDASMTEIGASWKALGDAGQAPFKHDAAQLNV